jgi:hypothetical protein
VCLAVTLVTARESKDPANGLVCDLHHPTWPFFPQHPSAYYVPRDLLEGLEASLDNSSKRDNLVDLITELTESQTQAMSNSSVSKRPPVNIRKFLPLPPNRTL